MKSDVTAFFNHLEEFLELSEREKREREEREKREREKEREKGREWKGLESDDKKEFA